MKSLLNPKGKLVGVLFDKEFTKPDQPFGGCKCQYKPIFEPYFDLLIIEPCYNSIASRKGDELFILFTKK